MKSKGLIFGILGLLVAILLLFFTLFKNQTEILSIKDFKNLIKIEQIRNVSIDESYLYFNIGDKSYKVAKIGIDSENFGAILQNIPLKVKTRVQIFEIFSDLGLLVLILVGMAVFLKVFSLMIKKDSSQNVIPKMQVDLFKENLTKGNEEFGLNHLPINSSVRFKDVAGIKEVKEELLEIIDYLKSPKKYEDLGISLPKGVLLVGPPGVGKTLIAKAVAGESGVPFYYHSGSSFVQIYVGMGAKRVRELFSRAKANAPSIVFIDEIDAVGKARGGNRNDEREATLNQLLTEMDGFEDSGGVIVIGATNKIEIIDEALLRSGRFDRRIFVELPDLEERMQILQVYLRGKKYDLELTEVSKMCVGFSGAMLSSLINESALNSLKRGSSLIQIRDILDVRDKVALGKKKILSFNEQERNILSVYQSAKAVSAYWLEIEFDKVTLVGDFLIGVDKEMLSKSEMNNKIKVYLSGTIALELMFNEKYTHAQEDIKKARKIAKDMCEEYGMGARLIAYEDDILEILSCAYKEQRYFLENSKNTIELLAQSLLEKEKLSKEVIKEIMQNAL